MGLVHREPFSRPQRSKREPSRLPGRTGRISLFVLLFISLALLVLSRIEPGWLATARMKITEAVTPGLQVMAKPAAEFQRVKRQIDTYRDLFAELEVLKRENQRLRQWEWRAKQLEQQSTGLLKLLNGVGGSGFDFTTGRVISDGRGPFARSVLLDVGSEKGVQGGHAVVNADGLVGRVVETGEGVSRVLLVNDVSSRIPVRIGKDGLRAVLIGNNGVRPRLEFIPRDKVVAAGDEVYTSGEGGFFAPGLRIGLADPGDGKGEASVHVQLHADLTALDYASVLLFTSSAGGSALSADGRFKSALETKSGRAKQ